MKLAGAAAMRYFVQPEPDRAGLLIYGSDAMRVALGREDLVLALVGPEGAAEMRLTRLAGADLRRDAALVSDAMRSASFFPGPRVVLVEGATDTVAGAVGAALADWQAGDATVIVTAGSLGKGSGLRKLFEGHPNAYAAAIYDDPPSYQEIETWLSKAGLADVGRDAMADLTALARAVDPGEFRQTVEKLALYKRGDAAPVTPADVAAVAPALSDADIDELVNLVAEGRAEAAAALFRRSAGLDPVRICIEATRHFRALHAASADPGGPGAGIGRVRPPIFGPRRERMVRQAGEWGAERLGQAVRALVEADLTLRSASRAPARELIERALIRLARPTAR